MEKRVYGFCKVCNHNVFNVASQYLKNIHHVNCGECGAVSNLCDLRIETKETDEFITPLSPYEALSELRKGTKLEYFRDDFWWNLYDDQPIYMLWKYKLRIKS